MQVRKIFKFNRSYVVCIPKGLMRALGLKRSDYLLVAVEGKRLVMQKLKYETSKSEV